MKVLFLAPEPFYQERGTPIAVKLATTTLAKRSDTKVDLLTYHEGEDIALPGVQHYRIPAFRILNGISPGISIKKLICDLLFFFTVIRMVLKNRQNQYSLIHAVEESVFIALFVRVVFGIPYIYDMDSCMSDQLVEKWYLLKPFLKLFEILEGVAVRYAKAIVVICDSLEQLAKKFGAKDTQILSDISLFDFDDKNPRVADLRGEAGLPDDALVLLYVGNLEHYQGIDLLLESFALCAKECSGAHVVVIGGVEEHIQQYGNLSSRLDIQDQVHLLGPRPVAQLQEYLLAADILLSPRSKGNNTPMKIYSYLHSGIPVLATNLPTHTQVMNSEVSMLADANKESFSRAMKELILNKELRNKIGSAAHQYAEENYTYPAFERSLNAVYNRIGAVS